MLIRGKNARCHKSLLSRIAGKIADAVIEAREGVDTDASMDQVDEVMIEEVEIVAEGDSANAEPVEVQ